MATSRRSGPAGTGPSHCRDQLWSTPHLAEEHQRMTLTGTLTRGGGRLRALLLVALSVGFGACDGTDRLTNADETAPASVLPAAAAPVALFAGSSTGNGIPFGVSHVPNEKFG